MNYYKSTTIQLPDGTKSLDFELIATNIEELETLGYTATSPFVLAEDVIKKIPFKYGIYLKKINKEGYLEDLSQDEINAAEIEYYPNLKNNLRKQLLVLNNEILLAERMEESTDKLLSEFNDLKNQYKSLIQVMTTEKGISNSIK